MLSEFVLAAGGGGGGGPSKPIEPSMQLAVLIAIVVALIILSYTFSIVELDYAED
ncbi:MAG: hypothetical protein SV760_07550 [Halobacteria archaeon]|nr:hypothetical protein [Halobacteria archaeon]